MEECTHTLKQFARGWVIEHYQQAADEEGKPFPSEAFIDAVTEEFYSALSMCAKGFWDNVALPLP